ncbi:MAG: homoserine dehydrogenase [Deferribacteraceae bacterium]|jgi:homoserine dehydrogenase|nr:homoserine dehydrogenase [Deferribacteraceae bacterium]
MNKVNVGIIGYGVVGKGTVDTLVQNKETIRLKTGIEINLMGVADLAFKGKSPLPFTQITATDGMELINNPDIHIIVELIGGYDHSKRFITAAINNGKHIVTANKALLAVHGKEIFTLAKEKGVEVEFEASVGGGIPIIKVIKEDLVANNISEINAIINGTANYILSCMTNEGQDYALVLKDAQKLGYAEANPSFDVDGIDSAHKITLLSSIAFGTWVDFNKVYTEGITRISAVDIDFAKELGCTIKLLAIAKKNGDEIEVRVHPTMIPNHYQLASVNGVFNAVQIHGDIVGNTLHYGRGAGGMPTGSAITSDIVNIARNIVNKTIDRVPALGFEQPLEERYRMKSIKDVVSSFYMRFMAADLPGVLSSIAGILAKNNISIRSALQRGLQPKDENVPLVFLTHETTARQIDSAVKEIDNMDLVSDKTVIIRVEGIE